MVYSVILIMKRNQYILIKGNIPTKQEAIKLSEGKEYRGCIVNSYRERVGEIGSKVYVTLWGIYYSVYK